MLKITKIKPLFTGILTTCDYYDDEKEGKVIMQGKTKGTLKDYQKVLAVGSAVRDIKVGDMVWVNYASYLRKKYDKNSLQNDMDNNPTIGIMVPTADMQDENGNTQKCLLLQDRDVSFVFEGEEVKESKILVPDKKLVIN